jgi:hypothetical protein
MFGPSLKSVPGCLVSIVPMLIGVPVAATPGLGPHEETLTLLELLGAAELLALLLAADVEAPLELLLLLLLLLLLPHPAIATAAISAVKTTLSRKRGT